jgi:outer membrane protein OmpA-like peptidoglycan-associated protein
MKKALFIAITAASVAVTASPEASADVTTETKQGVTAVGAMVTGAIAGGPPGAIVGLVTGAWLAGELGRADELDATLAALDARDARLSDASQRVARLEKQLGKARRSQQQLEQSMLESLELALMFRTGEAALSVEGKQQLAGLSRYLKRNPDLRISVQGFADPRGDDAANLALSKARASAVVSALTAGGVDPARVSMDAFGEQHSQANAGDIDAMALERKVIIALSRPKGLAQRTR